MIFLKNCKFVITSNPDDLSIVVYENIDIKVNESGLIECIDKDLKIESGYEVIDCSNYIVIPGLINAHTHAAMVLFRGYCDDFELHEWLSRIWEVERELTPEVIRYASELAIMEMISTGITGFVDMYFYPEETAQICEEYGIRCALGPVFLDLLYDPKFVENQVRNFYFRFRNSKFVKPIINVHSIYACSKDTLERVRDLSNELNLNIQIHVSETRQEVFKCRKETGMFPVEYLNSIRLASEKVQMVHLGWITNWEINIIKEKNVFVTYCPTSNMKLATAGFFPFREMFDMGIRITIGTDGAASNNCLNIFREMKNAVLLQRHSYWDTSIKARHVFISTTLRGYELLGIKGGCIREGYVADLVLLNAKSITLQPIRKDNLLSNLVYSATGNEIEIVIINGKIIYNKKQDLEKWIEKSQEISEKLNNFISKFIR